MKELPVLAALREVRAPIGDAAIRHCRRDVTRRLRALPAPRSMIPAEQMAARVILARCKACGGCDRAL